MLLGLINVLRRRAEDIVPVSQCQEDETMRRCSRKSAEIELCLLLLFSTSSSKEGAAQARA